MKLIALLALTALAVGCAPKRPVKSGAYEVIPKDCVKITGDCTADGTALHCPHAQVICTRIELKK